MIIAIIILQRNPVTSGSANTTATADCTALIVNIDNNASQSTRTATASAATNSWPISARKYNCWSITTDANSKYAKYCC